MVEQKQFMELKVPADVEYALIVRMALAGYGMVAGLEIGLIDDLRTVTDECFDCLLHQGLEPQEIQVLARCGEGRLWCEFCAISTVKKAIPPLQDQEVTRCILETLLPDVRLGGGEEGICRIEFSMPI